MKIKKLSKIAAFVWLSMLCIQGSVQATVYYPSTAPGKAQGTADTRLELFNDVLKAQYSVEKGVFSLEGIWTGENKVVGKGQDLFVLKLQNGKKLASSEMVIEQAPVIVDLLPDKEILRASKRLPGKKLQVVFSSVDKSLKVGWAAELRDGSHYLRTELTVLSKHDVEMEGIEAMKYHALPDNITGEGWSVSGNTRGALLTSPSMFAALETPMAKNVVLDKQGTLKDAWKHIKWTESSWTDDASNIPDELKSEYGDQIKTYSGPVIIDEKGEMKVTFQYESGHFRLNTIGIQVLNEKGEVVSQDIHEGYTGWKSEHNIYTVNIPQRGKYTVKYWAETKTETLKSEGKITYSLPVKKERKVGEIDESQILQGVWDRKETLRKNSPWEVSSVIGILTPGQERRSFLAYFERERAVPYRPFIHYNSWFELNVHTNNNPDPLKRMVEKQCLDILAIWQDKMYNKRKVNLDSFVWDDGWDDFNSLWGFHKGFPNGFKKIAQAAKKQKAGIGAWLGPVGGYYQSKQMRLASWNKNHPHNQITNFQLANEEYYDAFSGRCRQMIKDYGMNYFKLDGISTMATTKGPDPKREEDAEGILRLVADLRKAKQDVYLNCTVGTWASPFWFLYADSIWRQGGDHGFVGAGNNREKWITYRDDVIWNSFVKDSPLCPINSLMFHGVTISKNGAPAGMPQDNLQSFKNEMRCAVASGSSLQELYVDHEIMTSFENEILWDELAKCIKWFRKNADVLVDTHWVGGNPKALDIYGWASWNPNKAVFALRNPSQEKKSLTITLRQVLDLPQDVKKKFTFKNVFDDQRQIEGFTGTAVSPDVKITIELEPFEVIVWEQ